jgi:hypothetical protein
MILKNNINAELIVDDDCPYNLKISNWTAIEKRGKVYFRRNRYCYTLKKHVIQYLHRLILDAKKGEYVDHINGDLLDNRKSNLRLCSNSQNIRNQNKHKDNTSGYKGVSYNKRLKTNPWSAQIKYNRHSYHLGYYPTKELAAIAYNNKAIELFKEFARLNEIQ